MNKRPKVSVIIPAYNAEKTIGRCLDSIISQTYNNIEIIIINDGSSDDTDTVIKSIKDHRIIYISNSNNGVSISRNLGIRKSSGDYVMFCDADDTYEENAIEELVVCARKTNADVIKFGVQDIYRDDVKKEEMGDIANTIIDTSKRDNRNKLFKEFFYCNARQKCLVMSLFIRRSFLIKNNILFDRQLYMMEDVVFFADLFNSRAKVFLLDRVFYDYYIYPESSSQSKKSAIRVIARIHDVNIEFRKRIDDPRINAAHFRALCRCIIWNYQLTRKFSFLSKAKEIAERSNLEELPKYWRIAGRAIIRNHTGILRALAFVWIMKDKIRELCK